MCCLCNYICKWLDIQVFSDKDYKPSAPSPASSVFMVSSSSRCGGLSLVHLTFHAWVGRVSEIIYGLIAAARGAFTSWRSISLNRIVNLHEAWCVICAVYKYTFIHSFTSPKIWQQPTEPFKDYLKVNCRFIWTHYGRIFLRKDLEVLLFWFQTFINGTYVILWILT